MSVNDKTPDPVSSSRHRARQLRIIGVVVLLLGLGGAGLVYWLGTHSPDMSDDPSMLGYNQAETRQMEMLYGKQGRLVEDLTNDLKQPGTQAILVAVTSVIIAAGCFHFARWTEVDNEAR